MRSRLSRWIAFGAGSGLTGIAPGTAGTLWAWAAWVVFSPWLPVTALAILIALGFVAGCWACGRAAQDLGVSDHGAIVWDEIVAFWLVLLVVPAEFSWQFAAFVLFRLFDIAKPPPIRHFERTVPGGLGVMFDDLLAAGYTLFVLAVWRTF